MTYPLHYITITITPQLPHKSSNPQLTLAIRLGMVQPKLKRLPVLRAAVPVQALRQRHPRRLRVLHQLDDVHRHARAVDNPETRAALAVVARPSAQALVKALSKVLRR